MSEPAAASDGLRPRAERQEWHRLVERWVGGFRNSAPDSDLAWICLPHLIIFLRLHQEGEWEARPATAERAQKLWTDLKEQPTRAESLTLAGEHLFLAFSENQRRAQAPVADLLGGERTAPVVEADAARLDELGEAGIELVADLIGAAASQGLALPVRRRLLYWLVLRAVRDLCLWEATLRVVRPRTVVIGSTQSSAARALALGARRTGIPSVYVPHAPVITEARLADLPVDVAALRGPQEIAHYRSHGADPSGMTAIGNPGLEPIDEMPALNGDRAAFALPVDDPSALASLVAFVDAALGDAVVASPHPRADPGETRSLIPAGWELWDGNTFQLLRGGPPALLQASSGTGLEGLLLGIPTIELGFPGEEPNYPFLSPPRVTIARTTDELRAATLAARSTDSTGRDEVREWAGEWVSATGAAAARAGAAAVERAAEDGPRAAAVWDAWT